ncbi:FlxA-like family protein [Herbaspirillum chlorophenolicum]|jgi:hypothetical protein|uniref:FlxA-like family protein n=1 Tax=Herbaspirillum chlorophenolicum TaxID=211589 RepID=UPI00067BB254|nr:FlxA-like family protein [Herbaspirillum chlorophenolicum]
MAIISECEEAEAACSTPLADAFDNGTSELVAQLSSRIVILQQQAQSLSRFPANKDGKQQHNILQQQIRNLYQQIFLLEQQDTRNRHRAENYLSMALSVAAHTAHVRSCSHFAAG